MYNEPYCDVLYYIILGYKLSYILMYFTLGYNMSYIVKYDELRYKMCHIGVQNERYQDMTFWSYGPVLNGTLSSMLFCCQARDEDLHGERSPQNPHSEDSPRLVLKINSNIRVRRHRPQYKA